MTSCDLWMQNKVQDPLSLFVSSSRRHWAVGKMLFSEANLSEGTK